MSSSPPPTPSRIPREETIAIAAPPPPPPRTDTDKNLPITDDSDAHGLAIALEEAERGRAEGGIPIGSALLTRSGERLGAGHNLRVQRGSPTLHAEIAALEHAGRLPPAVYRDCTLVSFYLSLFFLLSFLLTISMCVPPHPHGCCFLRFSLT